MHQTVARGIFGPLGWAIQKVGSSRKISHSWLVGAKTWRLYSAKVWLKVKIWRKNSFIFPRQSYLVIFRPAFIFLYTLSNWLRCQIGPGVKLTLLHSWCQIDSFTLLVSNWLFCTLGVKLVRFQIGSCSKLVPVPNFPKLGGDERRILQN